LWAIVSDFPGTRRQIPGSEIGTPISVTPTAHMRETFGDLKGTPGALCFIFHSLQLFS
jgi:hypothetical protein